MLLKHSFSFIFIFLQDFGLLTPWPHLTMNRILVEFSPQSSVGQQRHASAIQFFLIVSDKVIPNF